MDQTLLSSLTALKAALASDARVLSLEEEEKKIAQSDEVRRLATEKDRLSDIYESTRLRYGENAKETKDAYAELCKVKRELDFLPESLSYTKAYAEVNHLMMAIDDILFGDLRGKHVCGGHK